MASKGSMTYFIHDKHKHVYKTQILQGHRDTKILKNQDTWTQLHNTNIYVYYAHMQQKMQLLRNDIMFKWEIK